VPTPIWQIAQLAGTDDVGEAERVDASRHAQAKREQPAWQVGDRAAHSD
jgi:hypothetical protein